MEKLLTVPQAAEHLGVTPCRVIQLIRAGTLRAKKAGRDWRIVRRDVEARAADKPKSGRPRGRPKKETQLTTSLPQTATKTATKTAKNGACKRPCAEQGNP